MNTPRWYESKREKEMSRQDLGFVPKFSVQERDRRWNELRKKMSAQGLDALLFYGSDIGYNRGMVNFRYITHFADIHGGWALFPALGECTVFSGPVHMTIPYSKYAAIQDWVTDIRPNGGVPAVAKELKERGLDKGRLGIVSFGSTGVSSDAFPHQSHEQLLKLLPEAEFEDANALLTEMRMIKSKEEIDFLYKAGAIARKKVEAMIRTVKTGNTEADVFAEMLSADIKNGAEPLGFLLLSTGNVLEADPGYRFLVHGISQPASPSMRKLRDGDVAICEFHTSYGGYLAGVEFSVFLGTPPQELVNIQAACMEAIQAGVETIRPGSTPREAWKAIRGPVEKRGYDFCELGFHGHGMASPEYPLSVYREEDGGVMSGIKIADIPFEEDMVICLNIDVHDPGWRKDVGLMYGDMLHVTKEGTKKMVNLPAEFIVNES
ncbi:MAG: Xaa-Pro peptidase family protein [Clostridiales Family XIII bacterium]|nr:Xaa-Pro peptidase family protein [Clostridiales Family XIII bacterium]